MMSDQPKSNPHEPDSFDWHSWNWDNRPDQPGICPACGIKHISHCAAYISHYYDNASKHTRGRSK